MKISIFTLANSVATVALICLLTSCDWGERVEPTSDELERELENTPKAPDGPMETESPEVQRTLNFDCLDSDILESDLSMIGYEVVVIIDKAPDVQTVRVLERGRELYDWPTSTGAEMPKLNRLGTTSSRVTPTGYFTPVQGRLHENYHSSTWDASMPYSIFFNGGIALHATHPGLYPLLGQRASGGCVRLEHEHAQTLFYLVRDETGMGKTAMVDRYGCISKNSQGQINYTDGYKTLIVVINSD